jgi:hypothetical protein
MDLTLRWAPVNCIFWIGRMLLTCFQNAISRSAMLTGELDADWWEKSARGLDALHDAGASDGRSVNAKRRGVRRPSAALAGGAQPTMPFRAPVAIFGPGHGQGIFENALAIMNLAIAIW